MRHSSFHRLAGLNCSRQCRKNGLGERYRLYSTAAVLERPGSCRSAADKWTATPKPQIILGFWAHQPEASSIDLSISSQLTQAASTRRRARSPGLFATLCSRTAGSPARIARADNRSCLRGPGKDPGPIGHRGSNEWAKRPAPRSQARKFDGASSLLVMLRLWHGLVVADARCTTVRGWPKAQMVYDCRRSPTKPRAKTALPSPPFTALAAAHSAQARSAQPDRAPA